MTAVCVDATTPRTGPRTVRCSKLLTVRDWLLIMIVLSRLCVLSIA